MENPNLTQALILWYVVIIALETTDLSGGIGNVFEFVGSVLAFSLPFYIVGGVVAMFAEELRT